MPRSSILTIISPLLGGFLAGLIIPHENGFAIALVEKIEDLISILLLPIVRQKPSLPLHSSQI